MPSLFKMMAEFGLNITPFQGGMRQAEKVAEKGMENIGHRIKGLVAGYFGFHALQHAILGVAEKAVKIGEMSKQFSITTDEVQKLGIAAEHVGLDFEAIGAGLDKLGAARAEAAAGNEKLIATFNRIGVGQLATDLDHISNLDLAKHIGEAFSKMNVNDETRQILRELMGRGGPRLLEVLKGIEHTEHEPLISKEDIDNIHEAEIALKGLERQWAAFIAPAEGEAAQFWSSVIADTEKAHGAFGKYAAAFKSYWQNLFGVTGDEDKHIKNALPMVPKPGLKSAPEGFNIMDWVLSGKIPEEAQGGGKITSPKAVTDMLKAQFDVQKKMEEIAFSRADKQGKIGILQAQITESHASELRLKQQLNAQLITQEEYERHIAEQKLDQLEAEQKIYELRKQGGLGYEGFRRLASAAGFNPATFQPAPTTAAGGATELGKIMVKHQDLLAAINAGIQTLNKTRIILGR